MRMLVTAMTVMLAVSPAAWAAGDKTQETMVDISSLNGGLNGFANGTSTAKIKTGACKIQLQLKGLTGVADGDVLICIAGAEVRAAALGGGAFGNSLVMRGVAKNGGLKIKADLTKVGCGGAKAINYNSEIRCYKPDANYTNLSSDLVNWKATCSASGTLMLPIVNPDAIPTSDAAKVNLLGLCQGLTADDGERITPPTSGEICRQGATNRVL